MSVREMILFAPVMFATLRRIPERTLRHWMYIWFQYYVHLLMRTSLNVDKATHVTVFTHRLTVGVPVKVKLLLCLIKYRVLESGCRDPRVLNIEDVLGSGCIVPRH
jgi:hypothetical protein